MKNKNNSAWKIEGNILYTKAQDLNNSKTDPDIITIIKNSENSAKTTAEYIILTEPKDYASVASLPATRIAKYAGLAIINTNLQIEKDLKFTFEKLYPYILDYSTSKEFKETVNKILKNTITLSQLSSSKAINNIISNKEEQEAKNLYETIKANYHKLSQELNLKTPEYYLEKILYDRIRMKILEDEIISDLEPKILKQAELQGLKRLTEYPEDRTAYCFYGAPASGKSKYLTILQENKNFTDIARIDTNSHRNFVIDDRLIIDKIENKSAFTHSEAGFISNMSYRLYEKKINENKAPNLLIVTIEPHQYIIDLATKNEGKALIYLMTIPAEKCVERAYERGTNEKRFPPTDYIINANIKLAKNFHNIMTDNIGKNIEYKILDNDIEKGEKPILIEHGDLRKKQIKIYDKNRLEEFLRKQNLNPNAQNTQDLYSKNYYEKSPIYKFSNSSFEVDILEEIQTLGDQTIEIQIIYDMEL